MLRILLRGTRTTLRRASPAAPGDTQLGAVSFLHRFGSALNHHFHFHVVVLDGVFSDGDDGSITFHEATHLTADDVLRLERMLQRRVLRLFQRRGLLDAHTVENMLTWQASGGFSLDASVRIHGSDAGGRERLLRYCARPPVALERLRIERRGEEAEQRTATAAHGDAGVRQVVYLPAQPTRDGRTVLALSPLEFLAALARLIPPPRVHRHRYHGVLAPNARLREQVIHLGRDDAAAPGDTASLPDGEPREDGTARDAEATDLPAPTQHAAARSRWARLLARIYDVFPLTCPDCGGDMRILAFITAAEPVDAILSHLGLPTNAPPLSPARGPPQHDLAFDADPGFDLDQTPAYDPAEAEPVSDFDFDQSAGASDLLDRASDSTRYARPVGGAAVASHSTVRHGDILRTRAARCKARSASQPIHILARQSIVTWETAQKPAACPFHKFRSSGQRHTVSSSCRADEADRQSFCKAIRGMPQGDPHATSSDRPSRVPTPPVRSRRQATFQQHPFRARPCAISPGMAMPVSP